MSKLLYVVGATVGSGIGWWLGEFVGMGTAFFLSAIGTGVGIYVARRVNRDYFA
jgi:hypothetical protein